MRYKHTQIGYVTGAAPGLGALASYASVRSESGERRWSELLATGGLLVGAALFSSLMHAQSVSLGSKLLQIWREERLVVETASMLSIPLDSGRSLDFHRQLSVSARNDSTPNRPLDSALTVVVNENELRFYFGPGVWRRRFVPDDIRRVDVVRNSPLYGWGIRYTPHGWLYKVSGLRAVELTVEGEGPLRIGTDEPEALKRALEEARTAV